MYVVNRAFSNFMNVVEAFGGSLITAGLIALLLLRWGIRWFVFRKAGEKGWKSFIPFYGAYISYKIVWDGKIYWTLLLGLGATCLLSFPFFFLDEGLGTVLSLLLNTISLGAFFVAGMLRKYKMARSFGMQDKHFVGLCLMNNIFSCIAAFGDYEYQGVQYKDGIGVPSVLANMGQRPAAPVYQQPYQPAPQAYQPYQPQPEFQPPQDFQQPYQPAQPQQPIARRSDRANNPPYGQY